MAHAVGQRHRQQGGAYFDTQLRQGSKTQIGVTHETTRIHAGALTSGHFAANHVRKNRGHHLQGKRHKQQHKWRLGPIAAKNMDEVAAKTGTPTHTHLDTFRSQPPAKLLLMPIPWTARTQAQVYKKSWHKMWSMPHHTSQEHYRLPIWVVYVSPSVKSISK